MPLLDHFHSDLDEIYSWEAIHSGWAGTMVTGLNRILPENFTAIERQCFGGEVEINVATFELASAGIGRINGHSGCAPLEAPVYSPPDALSTVPFSFPDITEVRIYQRDGGSRLVAAIEIVSPGNKDRPEERRAFTAKCASFLSDCICLIVIDMVTSRSANLHAELLKILGQTDDSLSPLYAATYRPVVRNDSTELDILTESLTAGETLPIMPLRLVGDLFVPLDLEATYIECCQQRRLI